MPFVARGMLAVVLVAAFARAFYRYFSNRNGAAVRGVEFQRGRRAAVLNDVGAQLDFGDMTYRYVSPMLSTFVIANGGARRHVFIVMPDSLPKEDYRRLRVRLNGTTI